MCVHCTCVSFNYTFNFESFKATFNFSYNADPKHLKNNLTKYFVNHILFFLIKFQKDTFQFTSFVVSLLSSLPSLQLILLPFPFSSPTILAF